MNLLILSDFHIGPGEGAGSFGWSTEEFISSLEIVKARYNIDKVVLNGDIFEMYTYRYADIEESMPELVNYFKSPDFVYIRGNHDAWCHYGLDSYTIKNSEGKTIYIEHGHNADFLNGTRVGRMICLLFFAFIRQMQKSGRGSRWYIRLLERIDDVNRIPKKYDTYKYLKYALNLLRTYDVVVLAHTHKLEEHKTYYLHHKKRYLNSGSCSLGRFQGIVLDTETLQFGTLKLDRKKMRKLHDMKSAYLKVVRSA